MFHVRCLRKHHDSTTQTQIPAERRQLTHFRRCQWCGIFSRQTPRQASPPPPLVPSDPMVEDPMGVCTVLIVYFDRQYERTTGWRLRVGMPSWCAACASFPLPLPSGSALGRGSQVSSGQAATATIAGRPVRFCKSYRKPRDPGRNPCTAQGTPATCPWAPPMWARRQGGLLPDGGRPRLRRL